ncbi:MAG: glycosyltransferase [Mycobacteriales bacterium]
MTLQSVTFVLGKHPDERTGGDVVMSELMMALTAEAFSVRALALAAGPVGSAGGGVVRPVAKPQLGRGRLLMGSRRSRRSLVHERFDVPALRDALREQLADGARFVAEHSYMAESFLSVAPDRAASSLWVDTHVSESDVWGASPSPWKRVESRRLRRDEWRVAQRARAVGCFDADEAQRYRDGGISRATYLDVTMPPSRPSGPSGLPGARLVFLGSGDWSPNLEALTRLLRLWPDVRRSGDGELLVVGKGLGQCRGADERGVRRLGWVDDLGAVLADARGLVAPIRVGGGVRVKVLEAAAAGLPVVGTTAALGSLSSLLPLVPHDSDEAVVEECRRLLDDDGHYQRCASELFEANRSRWTSSAPHRTVEAWLT